ncbi:hypothetical protein [Nocardioides sp. GCM10030258]|uniref:hypothetical protein n=1 Tax=unclassified Nocardioides TaxID=2615069 RepID=UPI00360EC73F
MNSDERPTWLADALSRKQRNQRPTHDPNIRRGQLRRLESMDHDAAPSRLVLIVDVDPNNGFATVALLSPEADNGSDLDRVVLGSESGLTYDLLLLSDVAGPAWFLQLQYLVSTATLSFESLPIAGVHLRDEKDARWSWKEKELEEFIALTGECRLQLLDGERFSVVDPVALDLEVVSVEDHLRSSDAINRLVANHEALIPREALDDLAVPITHQAHDSIQALRFTAARNKGQLLATGHPADRGSSLRSIEDDPLQVALASLVVQLKDSTRCVRVMSVSSLWQSVQTQVGPPVLEYRVGGRRLQIIVNEVDVLEAARA